MDYKNTLYYKDIHAVMNDSVVKLIEISCACCIAALCVSILNFFLSSLLV